MPAFAVAQIKYNSSMEKVLPYIWGIDGSYASFMTDYVAGGLCILYGLVFLWCMFNIRSVKNKVKENRYRRDELPVPNKVDGRTEKLLRRHLEDMHHWLFVLSGNFFACGMAHGAAGLVHHKVQNVDSKPFPIDFPELPPPLSKDGVGDDVMQYYDELYVLRQPLMYWYIVWQSVKILAIIFAFFLFLIVPCTLVFEATQFPLAKHGQDEDSVEEEGERRKLKVFNSLKNRARQFKGTFISCYSVLFTILMIYNTANVIVYAGGGTKDNRQWHEEIGFCRGPASGEGSFGSRLIELWDSSGAAAVLALSILFCAVFFTLLTPLRQPYKSGQDDICLSPLLNRVNSARFDEDKPGVVEAVRRGEDAEKEVTLDGHASAAMAKSTSQPQCSFWISPLNIRAVRCLGIWLIFASGVLQLMLSPFCRSNDATSCPLPPTFNHNAVYHCGLLLGATVWFIAEYVIYRQEVEIMYVAMKSLKRIRVLWMFTFLTTVNRLNAYNAMEKSLLYL